MKIERQKFGVLSDGTKIDLFILEVGELKLTISSFGGTLLSLLLPSASGGLDDVLLGFSTLSRYTENHPYFGVTVGRYANRIAGASFKLQGKSYQLPANDGQNCLHGGFRAFDKQVWKAEAYSDQGGAFVKLSLESPDGDQGFPGKLLASVSYGLNQNHQLIADYQAKLEAVCPVNLTNHAYFNLKGQGAGDILSHELSLNAASYLVSDTSLIPTGRLAPVDGGAFDFRQPKAIGADIAKTDGGYDHCFVVEGESGQLRPCAKLFEPASGRAMTVLTTQPGVQFYSGNFLNGIAGKSGSIYNQHAGLCLETQHFPDSPNHANFPDCLFGPEKPYHERTVFNFTW